MKLQSKIGTYLNIVGIDVRFGPMAAGLCG